MKSEIPASSTNFLPDPGEGKSSVWNQLSKSMNIAAKDFACLRKLCLKSCFAFTLLCEHAFFQVLQQKLPWLSWESIVGISQGHPPTSLSYWQRLSCGRSLSRASVLSIAPLCDEREDGVATVWYSPSYDTKGDLEELKALCLYQLSIASKRLPLKILAYIAIIISQFFCIELGNSLQGGSD